MESFLNVVGFLVFIYCLFSFAHFFFPPPVVRWETIEHFIAHSWREGRVLGTHVPRPTCARRRFISRQHGTLLLLLRLWAYLICISQAPSSILTAAKLSNRVVNEVNPSWALCVRRQRRRTGSVLVELVKALPKWLMNMSTEAWVQVRDWKRETIEYYRHSVVLYEIGSSLKWLMNRIETSYECSRAVKWSLKQTIDSFFYNIGNYWCLKDSRVHWWERNYRIPPILIGIPRVWNFSVNGKCQQRNGCSIIIVNTIDILTDLGCRWMDGRETILFSRDSFVLYKYGSSS